MHPHPYGFHCCAPGRSNWKVLFMVLCTTRANETDGGEVNAVLKELEACTDVAARQLRLSTFDKAEKEKRELQNEEAELEKTISSLDESQDGAEIAAVRF